MVNDQGDTQVTLVVFRPIMIDAFIRGNLGTVGVAILNFYIANSFWINGLLLLYALLVVLARRAFDLSCQSLVSSLHSQHDRQFEQKNAGSILKILKKSNIPWDQALASSSFPFLAPPGSIRVYPRNSAMLQKFLPLERLAELLAKP